MEDYDEKGKDSFVTNKMKESMEKGYKNSTREKIPIFQASSSRAI